MVDQWLRRVQAALLPPYCVLCGNPGQPPALDLCEGCAADLRRNRNPCPRCARPQPVGAPNALECPSCLRIPPPFDRAIVPYLYAYPLDRLIQAFKYRSSLAAGRVLGTLLARDVCERAGARPNLLVPVPLHPARHRERGFNQAFELARPMSAMLGIEIDIELCCRVRETLDQTQLSARKRRANLRQAFALREKIGASHVALIDDVVTTGSTCAELARTLKSAGLQTVEVWAVARSRPQRRAQVN